jgi:hypothetical protein
MRVLLPRALGAERQIPALPLRSTRAVSAGRKRAAWAGAAWANRSGAPAARFRDPSSLHGAALPSPGHSVVPGTLRSSDKVASTAAAENAAASPNSAG